MLGGLSLSEIGVQAGLAVGAGTPTVLDDLQGAAAF
jgi:hypothetical protein